jgi:carbon-monoxide dehydrogenase medium subunit
VKPPPFAYHAPRELDEALALLDTFGDEAKVLAGGQSLVPMLNFRIAHVDHLIDINRMGGGLGEPRWDGGALILPALVRQARVAASPAIAQAFPLLPRALEHVGHAQIRNRGTVCGSLAHADPAAELPTVMSALDARFTVASARGTRTVGVDDFFVFHLTTALEPDELLIQVTIDPPAPGTFCAFREFATRRGDFALAAVAAVCRFDESAVVTACRIAAAGVAPVPVRLRRVEALVTGNRLDGPLLGEAAALARTEVRPTGDIHASAAYRQRLTGVLVSRALADAHTQQEAADG